MLLIMFYVASCVLKSRIPCLLNESSISAEKKIDLIYMIKYNESYCQLMKG